MSIVHRHFCIGNRSDGQCSTNQTGTKKKARRLQSRTWKIKRKNTHDVSVFSIVCVYMKSANVPMAAKRQKQNLLLLCVERCYHMLMHRASCGSALTTCWIWNEWVWGRVNRQNFDLKFIMASLLSMNGQCFERKSSDIGRVHVELNYRINFSTFYRCYCSDNKFMI